MGNSYGASKTPDLFRNCVLWFTGAHTAAISGDFDEFPIIPSGVTVTNNPVSSGWTKDDLLNNKSVMRFDGSTNYVSLSDNAAWNFGSGDFTICFWANSLITTGYGCAIGQAPSGASRWVCYQYADANRLDIYVSGGLSTTSPTTFTPNAWHFVTIRGISGSVAIGIDLGFGTAATGAMPDISGVLMIGNQQYSAQYWTGNIKDLVIYKNRALTLPELTLLMRKTHPVTGTGVVPGPYSYWRGV